MESTIPPGFLYIIRRRARIIAQQRELDRNPFLQKIYPGVVKSPIDMIDREITAIQKAMNT